MRYIWMLLLIPAILQTSCRKLLEVGPPPNSLAGNNVFTSDVTATAAMVGVYSRLAGSTSTFMGGGSSITTRGGLSADELRISGTDVEDGEFYTNQLSTGNGGSYSLWQECYVYIYTCNTVISSLERSPQVSEPVRKMLTGEAKFMRAFFNFYLVNLYGNVPLVLSTDYLVNAKIAQSPAADVYRQVLADLDDAISLLGDEYPTGERIRPNKWVATALLARVHLYMGEWEKAETAAGSIIARSGTYELLKRLDDIYLKGSREAIWAMSSIMQGLGTADGVTYIFTTSLRQFELTPSALDMFETGDQRKTHWVAGKTINNRLYSYVFKYKERFTPSNSTPALEEMIIFRLAEQFLIRAEARAHLNDIAGARADLDSIRVRAGLLPTTASDQASLLLAIEQERRVELMVEMGHRWLDLKRTGRADAVLAPVKGSKWQTEDQFYPIPQEEINKNRSLEQNEGYN